MRLKTKENMQSIRSHKGLAVTALMAIIAVFIVGPLSMLIYEMTQYNLARQELKACVDSAALTAACSTTASNSSVPSVTQTAAMNQAAYMFAQNTILNQSLSTTPAYSYGAGNPTWTPVANRSQLYFQFLDPVTKNPVAFGSANGKIMRVFGSFAFVPTFAKFIGLGAGPYLAVERADGGLPQLDVVLCFDVSGSMDDFTKISLVNRYSNGSNPVGKTGYNILPGTTVVGGHSTNNGRGPLYWATGATNTTGSANNATYPMDIDSGGGNSYGNYYMNNVGHGTHTGALPPQSKATVEAFQGGFGFTDCVVNLDGTDTESNGITINGLSFPADDPVTHKGLGVLVEASRGNLENSAVANAAGVPWTTWGITPQPGYFQAYYKAAMSAQAGFPDASVSVPLRHPIGDAIVAAQSFFGVLSNDADVHFGLVTFSDVGGVNDLPGDPYGSPSYYLSTNINAYSGGEVSSTTPYPTEKIKVISPAIRLDPTPGPAYSKYSGATPAPINTVDGALFSTAGGAQQYGISTVVARGGTNIQDALSRALSMQLGSKTTDPPTTGAPSSYSSLNLGRKGATRAIVLFTDGLPTAGGDNGTSDPNAQAVARAAKAAGIPIYTIGLCLTPALQPLQTTVLTDATGSSGIAALSGNGATFTQTTNPAQLNAVFQNVARQLVQLVQ
jgi:Flp pilus assembly protein TadG